MVSRSLGLMHALNLLPAPVREPRAFAAEKPVAEQRTRSLSTAAAALMAGSNAAGRTAPHQYSCGKPAPSSKFELDIGLSRAS